MSVMTSRERWLAALRCEPVDRIPFWPKIDGAYPRHQTSFFREMKPRDLISWTGGDLHIGIPNGVRAVQKHSSIDVKSDGIRRITTFRTVKRTLTYIEGFDETSRSHHPIVFPVKTIDDIEALTELYDDTSYEPDDERLEEAKQILRESGETGICVTHIGISPLMDWLQHLAGIQNGTYLLYDYPEAVSALFDSMHRGLTRRAEIIANLNPAPVVYAVENTSTTLISPSMFRRFCEPYLTAYGRLMADAGKVFVLHMCGKLKGLLPDIGRVPAHANEAFTSAPVGDTSLLDGRTMMPSRCLIGGTNATLWLEPADTIIETIAHDLAELPHGRGIVLSSAGVMPPRCRPETIRRVADWIAHSKI